MPQLQDFGVAQQEQVLRVCKFDEALWRDIAPLRRPTADEAAVVINAAASILRTVLMHMSIGTGTGNSTDWTVERLRELLRSPRYVEW